MYPDPFTLQRLAGGLGQYLAGEQLRSVFSTSKSDLFFVFSGKKGFKITFFRDVAYFSFPEIHRFPLHNRMNWFEAICDRPVKSVRDHGLSRSFSIEFEEYSLVFKVFGRFSNIILFDQEGQPLSAFCRNYPSDLLKDFQSVFSEAATTSLSVIFKAGSNPFPDARAYWESLQESSNNNSETRFFEQVRNGSLSIFPIGPGYGLSCFPANTIIGEPKPILSGMDALSLFHEFTERHIRAVSFQDRKDQQIRHLRQEIAKTERSLTALLHEEERIRYKRSYSEIGDLIMANLNSIHTGVSYAELFDFYRGTKLRVKLKPDLSPQENAAVYYKKAKNETRELEYHQRSMENTRVRLEKLKRSMETLDKVRDVKDLRQHNKTSTDKGNGTPLPYREFAFRGFRILAGKSGKSNDELLSRFSQKNDWWLHARDLPGSHILIKQSAEAPLPDDVLEVAASVAAYFSKGKTMDFVPVMYTRRKYVRKPREASPGKVIAERTKTVLVRPALPE